ncbi:MAG: phosphoenolpyruvate synthase [Methylophaga sp.]|nr:MAG: phosphoenolpyruvate synthase [Methylophaga sp.]
MNKYVIPLEQLNKNDLNLVGGKNASLGEMIANLSSANVRVPGGFATTTNVYWDFLRQTGLEQKIQLIMSELDITDINALNKASQSIQKLIVETPFSKAIETAIRQAFSYMIKQYGGDGLAVAVRSSATAEDLPDASFAGQQETFLNVSGIDNVLTKIKAVFASLYNARAISYRVHQGFAHEQIAISAGVQQMVRSNLATSGVMFTLDTESGFRDVVFITANYGLGETIVQGAVNPDEFYVYKKSLANNLPAILRRNMGSKEIRMVYEHQPERQGVTIEDVPLAMRNKFCLADNEILELSRIAMAIEAHYQQAMDIEWAKDGHDGKLYIVQARPETVKNKSERILTQYHLKEKADVIITGRSIGQKIGAGKARIIARLEDMDKLQDGEILVTDMTDPDWEPVMKRASAIVTNRGGRTCHAAIIARELGVPAVVGCGNATTLIKMGAPITVSCSEGDTGFIYNAELPFTIDKIQLDEMPDKPVKIMLNVGNPDRAFSFSSMPNDGVGLARLEFIINRMIGIHPQALLEYDGLSAKLKNIINSKIHGYKSPIDFYVDKLTEGIATIAAAFNPKPVIVRLSDFKSNEYANLIGGNLYEPDEENPMLGFRGASRYVSATFKACFELECKAIKKVRDDMGLTNVQLMIPFVRRVPEAEQVITLLKENGLTRGVNDLKIIMMCEIPSNALLADKFLENFDGFSIGSNDMTQLTLAMDRDSGLIAENFDERDPAVKIMLKMAINACQKANKYVGICGQGPSDHPDLAEWLVEQNIESISLNPDTVIETWLALSQVSADDNVRLD